MPHSLHITKVVIGSSADLNDKDVIDDDNDGEYEPGLELVVGAVPLATLAALQQVSLGPLHHRQSAVLDPLLHELLSLLLDLIIGHLLAGHGGKSKKECSLLKWPSK